MKIKYPPVESEFEVQAWLWSELRRAGINARGEVPVHGEFGLRICKVACRFDIVVFDARPKPVCVLEVKARIVRHKRTVEDTKQGKRYPMFGVPVHFVYGMDGARAALEMIKASLPFNG